MKAKSRTHQYRRGIAVLITAAAAAFAAVIALGTTHAFAQSLITKFCSDPSTSDHVAHAGDTISCKVSSNNLTFETGSQVIIGPAQPSDATVPPDGCVGVTESDYTITAARGTTGKTCIYTVSSGSVPAGQGNDLGTELVDIPADTPANTSVEQTAKECVGLPGGLPDPACAITDQIPLPVGTGGPGSCVDGMPSPLPLGGCSLLPGQSSSPSPSTGPPSPAAPGSGSPPSGVQAGSTTPFTGGPQHPFPGAGAAIAAGGLALGLAAVAGPPLVRRMRRAKVRGDGRKG